MEGQGRHPTRSRLWVQVDRPLHSRQLITHVIKASISTPPPLWSRHCSLTMTLLSTGASARGKTQPQSNHLQQLVLADTHYLESECSGFPSLQSPLTGCLFFLYLINYTHKPQSTNLNPSLNTYEHTPNFSVSRWNAVWYITRFFLTWHEPWVLQYVVSNGLQRCCAVNNTSSDKWTVVTYWMVNPSIHRTEEWNPQDLPKCEGNSEEHVL